MLEKNTESDTEKAISKTLKIKGCYYNNCVFPSANNLINEAERHPMAYSNLKRRLEYAVINNIRLQLKGWHTDKRVHLHYTIVERNKGQKRDYDNIAFGVSKIVSDSLVKAKVIKDDSPLYLDPSTYEFRYEDVPYVKVVISELDTDFYGQAY